jgi:hypothetical protein
MSEMEKGIKVFKVRRSDLDANPPEPVKKWVEEKIAKLKSKRYDYIPLEF